MNLSEQRKRLILSLDTWHCDKLKNHKVYSAEAVKLIFKRIKRQDKRFIKKLKAKLEQYRFCTFIQEKHCNSLNEEIEDLAGKELIE